MEVTDDYNHCVKRIIFQYILGVCTVELINMHIHHFLTLPCELHICPWHLTQSTINCSEARRKTLVHPSALVSRLRLSRVSWCPYIKSNYWIGNRPEVDSIYLRHLIAIRAAFSFCIELFILFDRWVLTVYTIYVEHDSRYVIHMAFEHLNISLSKELCLCPPRSIIKTVKAI